MLPTHEANLSRMIMSQGLLVDDPDYVLDVE